MNVVVSVCVCSSILEVEMDRMGLESGDSKADAAADNIGDVAQALVFTDDAAAGPTKVCARILQSLLACVFTVLSWCVCICLCVRVSCRLALCVNVCIAISISLCGYVCVLVSAGPWSSCYDWWRIEEACAQG